MAATAHVTVAGERSARDALISGALAIRFSGFADRLVPPDPFTGVGSGNTASSSYAVPSTLLGPEETDLVRKRHSPLPLSGLLVQVGVQLVCWVTRSVLAREGMRRLSGPALGVG